MKLNKIILSIIACVFAINAQAQISPYVKELSRYVSPGNAPARPQSYVYAADGNGYLLLSDDHKTISRYDIKTGKLIETIFDIANTRENNMKYVENFTMSDNGRYLLLSCNGEYIYRRSYKAQYYLYEVRTRILKPLSREFDKQQAPLFSPDGRMVAFVADNDIYIKKIDYDSEVAVTKDGEKNVVINGIPDWVYEEEFSTNVSMCWAPDNSTLCYLRYDESKVPLYTLPIYQGACNPQDQYALYPGSYTYKYPVAGQPNSIVTLHSYDVDNRKIKDISLPDQKIEYIPRIMFGPAVENLIVATLNRDQNHYEIYNVNPKSGVCKSIYTEDTKAWVQPSAYENLQCLADGMIVFSSRSGYDHIYKYSYTGTLLRTLTKGDFETTAFYGFDAKGNCYYQAAKPTPMQRSVYKVDAKGAVTAISKEKGTNSADFAPDMSYAVFKYSDTTTPPIYTVNTSDGKVVRTLIDNAEFASATSNVPKREFFTFNSDGYTLNGYVVKMPGKTNLPVIMSQYSGPGSQSVLDTWTLDWENYYATQGYAIVCVDGRGTGCRGREFMDVVYKRLGYYETIDQVNAAKYVAQQPWADGSRIGIYGWSYGGYESLMAASAYDAPYAAAVSVAPVTSWRYYDTIYTERYMLTPQQNEKGYDTSSPVNNAGALKCPLLIMYGTSDDNVHPMNSLQYVSQLQTLGGLCDMFVFPNMNHSIYGCNARAVVYAKMLQFFNEKLSK